MSGVGSSSETACQEPAARAPARRPGSFSDADGSPLRCIRESLPYVGAVARRYGGRGLNHEELTAAGNLGLVEAALRYDPSRNVKFITYADWWIRKSIHEALEEQSGPVRVPRYQSERLRLLRRARARLLSELGSEPDIDRLAEASGMPPADVEKLLCYNSGSVSLEQPVSPGDDRPLKEMLADADAKSPHRQLLKRDSAIQLRRHLASLDRREQVVLSLRFGLGGESPQTLREAGRALGISRERVRQLELRALTRLKQLLVIRARA